MKLLLIEDHAEISKVIFEYFELKGYDMDYASDGKHGLHLAKTNHYDMIILDIMLPQIDGLSVCRQLRESGYAVPIIMLTACDEKQDILSGFEQGADDYLVKPFDLNILEARINANHKRFKGSFVQKKLTFKELSLDLTTHIAERGGCQFSLNHAQFKLLKLLMLKTPEIATREEIISEIWLNEEPEEHLIRNHVYRLRTLIDKPFKQAYIKTMPKVGYLLCDK